MNSIHPIDGSGRKFRRRFSPRENFLSGNPNPTRIETVGAATYNVPDDIAKHMVLRWLS